MICYVDVSNNSAIVIDAYLPHYFSFGRMFPIGETENTALKQCFHARMQLEEAIAGVMKAETQLKGNSREVRDILLALCLQPCQATLYFFCFILPFDYQI